MKSTDTPAPLSGIVPPMITPLASPNTLDHSGCERLVQHLIDGGVSGLFLLGTCGEGPGLPFKLQCELVERVCNQVNGRTRVLVGVSNTSLDDALGMCEHAADCGASAVVSTLPYYFPVPPDQRNGYLIRLARRSPLPLVVYNMPSCVQASITPSMLMELTQEANIAGFKDSGGELREFSQFCEVANQQRPDWCRLMGPEHLLASSVQAGGTGGVNGGANLCPGLFVNIYRAVVNGEQSELIRLTKQAQVLGRLYGPSPSVGSVISGLKMGLGLMGICDYITTELFPLPSSERWKEAESVIAQLATWDLVGSPR